MSDFFTFKTFLAQDILNLFYIIGVIMIPIVSWITLLWMLRRYAIFIRFYQGVKRSVIITVIIWIIRKIRFFNHHIGKKLTWKALSLSQKLKFVGLYLFILIFAEVFLRLIFEYLIAFMQMHEALGY